jgi:hypothetical protein
VALADVDVPCTLRNQTGVIAGTAGLQEVYLKASNTGSGDEFGYSVALSGDTLAVGAYHEASAAQGVGGNQADEGAQDSGAVYVFH